ncbi:MAG: glycosyltransferase family 4 protein, partial [Pseudomonadota bacterium]
SPDVVIASSTYPLDNIPAWLIAKRCGAKLVFEVHDLWPLSPMILGGMSRRHPFIVTMQLGEDFACRRSDLVVSMLPKADRHLTTRGMDASKFVYIPNGIDIEAWQSDKRGLPDIHTSTIERFRNEGRFIVGYAGAHGIANALNDFLEASVLARDMPVAFVLVGQGPEKERLQQRAFEAGLTNVAFLPPVPRDSVPALLEAMDALYIGWQRQPLYQYGVSPNKLLDYMMAGKPVIHAIEAGNDLVAESGCGISVPPEDPSAIVQAVKTLMSLTPDERAAMGAKGRDYVVRHHDYRRLARQFLDAVESIRN